MPTELRPKELGEWFKIGRKTSGSGWTNLCAGDPDSLGTRWKSWWSNLQPATRKESFGIREERDLDWSILLKPGPSGIFLVLVALLWWRARLGSNAEADSLLIWNDSVEDVTWVLCRLRDAYADRGKGTGAGETVTKTKKRK